MVSLERRIFVKSLKGLNVLVTGGAGFAGSHLVDLLLAEEAKVRVFDNLDNGKLVNLEHVQGQYDFIQGSILNVDDVARAFEDIDVVFHLACLGVRHSLKFPMENHRVNSEGTMIVLEQARKQQIQKFVYCSSSEVYGTGEDCPMTEKHVIQPCTIYGSSKFSGELYARAYYKSFGVPTVMVRPFNMYGPRSHFEKDSGELIPKMIVRALHNENLLIFGDGAQTRDFCYVEDNMQGLLTAAKHDELIGQVVNVGSNSETSIKDIAHMILNLVEGTTSQIQHVDGRPGDVLRLYSDTTKFRNLTGWEPSVTLEEGLKRTIAWFRTKAEKENLMELETAMNWK